MRLVGLLSVLLLLAGCNLQRASDVTPMPTPDLPRIELLAPANNATLLEGAVVDFDIVARDETAGIAKVELYIDDQLINTATPPEAASEPIFRVQMDWTGVGIGKHFVEVIAYRADGIRGDSAKITLEVIAPQ
jgi:hypothetical protein